MIAASPAWPATDAPGPDRYTVPLSALDCGGHLEGVRAEQAVQDVVAAATTAEACGYHRFWVGEHHASADTVSSSPAVLIAHIAARTGRIRVGAGGVMLPNHAPFTVAEQFATLQALHPGRIDLGLGRPATGPTASHRLLADALRRDPAAVAEFPSGIDELLGFLHHRGPEHHRYHALPLFPHPATPPGVVVLGAGEASARIAAERGLAFAFGRHLKRSVCRPEAVARYRASFEPGHGATQPHVIVAVNVVCAETDALAEELALRTATRRHSEVRAEIASLTSSPVRVEYLARKALDDYQVVHGSPATVTAALRDIVAELDADEIMLAPYEPTRAGRCRTLRLAMSRWRAPSSERQGVPRS